MSTTFRRTLAYDILHSDCPDRAFKLLALDFYFDDMPLALDVSSRSGVLSSLRLFYEYSHCMRDAALDKAPWNSPWLCTLFQIETSGEKVRMKPGTLLYEHFKRERSSPKKVQSNNSARLTKLSCEVFCENLKRLLGERLNTRISEKDRISSRLSCFDPCTQLTLRQTCDSNHSASHLLDESWFNQRVRFHLQQVMILDNLHAFGLTDFSERMTSQR